MPVYQLSLNAQTIVEQEKLRTIDESNILPVVQEKVLVDKVWSGHRVGFFLETVGDRQFVAYYNSTRRMVVGMRRLEDKSFTTAIIPTATPQYRRGISSTVLGWDSHNYITLKLDREGYIHLAGNMHVNKLTYLRSNKPYDISSFEIVDFMVGKNEERCTYPKFMEGPKGEMIFHYRDGGSGNGVEIYNVYDEKSKKWHRLLNQPLISGKGKSSAYMRGPTLGPDGWYHLIWMWRDTPDVATNHDLSYARSRDLLNWETVAGKSLKLPITPADKGTIIDAVPVKGGLHNSNHYFCVDSKGRVIVAYYKHDKSGDTQAYAARFEDGQWKHHQVSDWKGHHIFKGGGSGPSTFGTSLSLRQITQYAEGRLALPFSHWKAGRGLLVIDEDSLEAIRVDPQPKNYPASLMKATVDFPGIGVSWLEDRAAPEDTSSRYVLRWETLGSNRDRARQPPLPEASELVIYKLGN